MKIPEFLKRRFNLHSAPEVEKAVKRKQIRTGEKISQKPAERMQNYLDRFKEITESKNPEKRRLGMRALKKVLFDLFIIKPEDIPETYFTLQQQIARELGHGTITITKKMREEAVEVIQSDQRASLNEWVDYLASPDALYPDWAKYWAFRSLVNMSLYDKEKMQFGNRSKHTTAKFPELNREALAYSIDLIQKEIQGEAIDNPVKAGQNQYAREGKLVTDEQFKHLLTTENFAKYYAFAIEHIVSDNSELFKNTEGEWKVFKQGSDHLELTKTLQGHGTGWCTAGESTAKYTLEEGDFYVYFSKNALGLANIPRLAIRMEEDRIAEVRGVAHHQEIDEFISPVLEEKMSEFGEEGEVYKKKAQQMKRLTLLEERESNNNDNEELSLEDLKFLYEVDGKIEGFGYDRDPRINEIIDKRNKVEDMKLLFGSKDDGEFIVNLLDADGELRCKLFGVEIKDYEYDDNRIDWEEHDQKLTEFLEKHLPEMKNLGVEVAEKLRENYYTTLIADNPSSFRADDRLKVLEVLKENQSEDGGEAYETMLEGLLKGLSNEEVFSFIESQIKSGNYSILENIIPHIKDAKIPIHIAPMLINAKQVDLLASMLNHFDVGLDSLTALALISSGYSGEVINNLDLFRLLNKKVQALLIEDGCDPELIDENTVSFDQYLQKNPFGQLTKKNPFK